MKRSLILCIAMVSLFVMCLLGGCRYGVNAAVNGKADLPIPDTILLRNNETGLTLEYTAADEEFDQLYRSVNGDWGRYEGKNELCYYQMLYTSPDEKIPTYEAEFHFPANSVAPWHLPWSSKTSSDVIGVLIALDEGADKAAYIFDGAEDYRNVTALVFQPSDDTLQYALSLLTQ